MKYKNNYWLSKKDSNKIKDLLYYCFKHNKFSDHILDYIILLPENVGMEVFYKLYENSNNKILLLDLLANNKILRKNENQRSVKRLGYLINLMSKNKCNYDNILFLMRILNKIILVDRYKYSNEEILDIFSYKKKLENLDLELEKQKKINDDYKDKIEALNRKKGKLKKSLEKSNNEISDLNNKISKLLEVNKSKDRLSLKHYKNKLAGSLRPDYKNIQEIKDTDINSDIGKILKIKINKIYSKLIDSGIPLEE